MCDLFRYKPAIPACHPSNSIFHLMLLLLFTLGLGAPQDGLKESVVRALVI
jgi:hypothetical protein